MDAWPAGPFELDVLQVDSGIYCGGGRHNMDGCKKARWADWVYCNSLSVTRLVKHASHGQA